MGQNDPYGTSSVKTEDAYLSSHLYEKLFADGLGPGDVQRLQLSRTADVRQLNDHLTNQQAVLTC